MALAIFYQKDELVDEVGKHGPTDQIIPDRIVAPVVCPGYVWRCLSSMLP